MDSNTIRQSLLNIKNTQLELLNELRSEHQLLRKYTPPQPIVEVDEIEQKDMHYSIGNDNEISTIEHRYEEEQTIEELALRQKQLSTELSLLKKQNWIINEDYQKMKRSYFMEKQKVKQMESNVQFCGRTHLAILRAFHAGMSVGEIQSKTQEEIRRFQLEHTECRKTTIQEALAVICSKNEPVPLFSQLNMGVQIEALKNELNELVKTSKEKSEKSQERLEQLVKQLQGKDKQHAELRKNNEQLVRLSIKQQQVNKNLLGKVQQLKQQNSKLLLDLEQFSNKLVRQQQNDQNTAVLVKKCAMLEETLKQKQRNEQISYENLKKMHEVNVGLAGEKERLKGELKATNEKFSGFCQEVAMRQAKNEAQLQTVIDQKNRNIELHQKQCKSMRQHIVQLQKNCTDIMQKQQRTLAAQLALQNKLSYKAECLRTSTAINHLWKIKDIEYDNIIEMLRQLKV